jgi:WD40 repeat protein
LDFQNQGEITKTIITPTHPNLFFSRVAFSPDGRWFAYEDITLKEGSYEIQSRRLRIVSANGQEMQVVRWEPDWRLYRWNDPETLILELDSDLDPVEKKWTGDEPHTLILFKPLMGETKELSLPALHNPYRGDMLLKGPQENYDPTFQRVAYLYGDPDSGYMHFSLWDVQADELLWKRRSGNEMLFGTHWSPDGQWLAVASEVENLKAELFIVSRDGTEKQVTDLKSVFPGMNINIGDFDWSPDGRFISLWLNVREGEYYGEWRFAILNIETSQLVDYCFPSSPGQYPYSIWSPNSQLVAFQSYEGDNLFNDNPFNYKLIVLDVEKNEARKIPGVGWLWGWMVSP